MNNYSTVQQKLADIINRLESGYSLDSKTAQQALKVLSDTYDVISSCGEMLESPSDKFHKNNNIIRTDRLPKSAKVACQGVEGAYSHIACSTVFDQPQIKFCPHFEDVTNAVVTGNVEFGVLPIENSSAGTVEEVIELVCESGCYINTILGVSVQHCLCAVKGSSKNSIKNVYSHPQALKQCAGYLRRNGFNPVSASNMAAAAKRVAGEGDVSSACICSELGAEIYGLEILEKGIQDFDENYTRFIFISKDAIILPDAEIVGIALSFPNQTGALAKLLTQFSVFDLDLTKIQSMPIGGADFNVRFHLDFKGKTDDIRVENLLGQMYDKYADFQFLGNFRII